jgi:ABC-type amino acid transport substrate-binding protein
LRLTAFAFAIALSLAPCVRASETLSFGVVTAPPYGMERKDKSVGGCNRDMAELIAGRAGLKFAYRLEPLPRLISDLKLGKLDLMIMLSSQETRKYTVADILPARTLVLPALGQTLRDYGDLKGKTFAGLRGAIYNQRIAEDDQIGKYYVDSYLTGLRMTAGGRIDGVIGADLGLLYQMKTEGLESDMFGPPLVLEENTVALFGTPKLERALVARLKTATEDLRDSGALAAAAEKYLR